MADSVHSDNLTRAPSARDIVRFRTQYYDAVAKVGESLREMECDYQALRALMELYKGELPKRPAPDGSNRHEQTAYEWCADYVANKMFSMSYYDTLSSRKHRRDNPHDVQKALWTLAEKPYDAGYKQRLIEDLETISRGLPKLQEQMPLIREAAQKLENDFLGLREKARSVAEASATDLDRYFPQRKKQ